MRTFGQLLAVLFVVGFIAKYIWWIVLIAAAVAAWKYLPPIIDRYAAAAARRAAAERNRIHELAARADQQHRWTMAGDDRGIYGSYPPAV